MSFVWRAPRSEPPSNDVSNTSDYLSMKGFADQQPPRTHSNTKEHALQRKCTPIESCLSQKTETVTQLPYQKWLSAKQTIHCGHLRSNNDAQANKLSSIFLSTTVREILPKLDVDHPGPGHYIVQESLKPSNNKSLKPSKLPGNLLRQHSLRDYINASYFPVASIPSDSKRFDGHGNTSFVVGAVHQPTSKLDKENRELNRSSKNVKGTNFHLSKVQRRVFEPSKEVLDTTKPINLTNCTYLTDICTTDQSSSKLETVPSERRPRRTKLNTPSARTNHTKEDSEFSGESSGDQYMETTPGPGSYNYETSSFISKDFRSKRSQARKIFFTKEPRLISSQICSGVGPASYEVCPRPRKAQQSKSPSKIGFLAVDERFKPAEPQYSAESGLYRPRNSMENDMINELVKGFKGRFGKNAERFQECKSLTPGPGSYNPHDGEAARHGQEKTKGTHPYKSSVKRSLFDNIPNFPGPGDYQVTRVAEIKDEEFEELNPKRVPFNSSSPRQLFVDRIPCGQSSYLTNKIQKPKQGNTSPFKSKSPRFEPDPLNSTPGAGAYYSQKQDFAKWETPSFNLLFR